MELKIVDNIPSGNGIIGTREIQKGIKSGEIKRVIIAKNCPDWLTNKITSADGASNVSIEQFNGDERELGTVLGKSFVVAMAGFKE
jgi:large subunit ribosomal protein L30e